MEDIKKVLIIDDEEDIRSLLGAYVERMDGYEPVLAGTVQEGLELAQKEDFLHILCDYYLSPEKVAEDENTALEFIKKAKRLGIYSNIIVMSGKADIDRAIEVTKLGAVDYLAKPITFYQLEFALRRAEEREKLFRENLSLRRHVQERYSFSNIISRSPAMERIFDVIEKVKDYKTTVLITGESGTGKELVARALHFNSVRKDAPFIAINCGGIPETLLESEFFGHVKGAFTDAIKSKKGLFEEADGGTLFLDEIGDLPLTLQVKLLRVLQDQEIRPVGGTRTVKIDVRFIAATSKDLGALVKRKKFREDLYYRINVLSIAIPPLRERKEDIRLLINHFIEKYNEVIHPKKVLGVSPEAMGALMSYKWPGNVRELENVIERALILTEHDFIQIEDLPEDIGGIRAYREDMEDETLCVLDGLSIKKNAKRMERKLITLALAKTKGNRTHAAQLLEISIPALLYKIKEYRITEKDYSS